MTKQKLKVLVAGGAGFIGSHIVDALLKAEMEVSVLDNLYMGRISNFGNHRRNRNFHFIKGDVRNLRVIKKAIEDIEVVFNLAAIVSVPLSVEDPLLVNDVNVGGTLNLLKASADSNVKRFVQSSSASIYGNVEKLPIVEETAPDPVSPYAVAELAAESYAKAFHRVYGIETVSLRYFNVYGPRQIHSAYSGAITIFINQLLQDKSPSINGDGEQTRDFVYVEDVVAANILAFEKKNVAGRVFNVSAGKATSINELVCMLQEITEKTSLQRSYADPRKGDICHSYANIEKARRILGYEPQYSLKEGLKKTVKWFLDQHSNSTWH